MFEMERSSGFEKYLGEKSTRINELSELEVGIEDDF